MNGYRLPEQDLRAIGKNHFAACNCFGLNRQFDEGTVITRFRMFLPVYPVPIMKNMIRNVLLPAPLLLRKVTLLPGTYACKHLLPDWFIFCHDCFLAKLFCRLISDKRQFAGGLRILKPKKSGNKRTNNTQSMRSLWYLPQIWHTLFISNYKSAE